MAVERQDEVGQEAFVVLRRGSRRATRRVYDLAAEPVTQDPSRDWGR